jgi:hypothetical protein
MSRVVVRFNRIPEARRVSNHAASDLVRAVGHEIERYVKQSFGTGRSAPGNPPGVDTGALRASIHVELVDALTVLVADGVSYGVHLEFGTTRMAARPFMLPGLVWGARQVQTIARGLEWAK